MVSSDALTYLLLCSWVDSWHGWQLHSTQATGCKWHNIEFEESLGVGGELKQQGRMFNNSKAVAVQLTHHPALSDFCRMASMPPHSHASHLGKLKDKPNDTHPLTLATLSHSTTCSSGLPHCHNCGKMGHMMGAHAEQTRGLESKPIKTSSQGGQVRTE